MSPPTTVTGKVLPLVLQIHVLEGWLFPSAIYRRQSTDSGRVAAMAHCHGKKCLGTLPCTDTLFATETLPFVAVASVRNDECYSACNKVFSLLVVHNCETHGLHV